MNSRLFSQIYIQKFATFANLLTEKPDADFLPLIFLKATSL